MELKKHWFALSRSAIPQILGWVNLRPEESERTWLMFAFYTTTSIGLRWAEDGTVALFLGKYGANSLPLIYIAGAAMSAVLSFFYSWLQKILPLRVVIVAIAPCMVLPLLLLRVGLELPDAIITIFMLRLWVDALYIVNDLNTSIAANQLFNIREIKRAYPLVSSGMLVADVISGFSLPLLLQAVGLHNVILVAVPVILLGTPILVYLTNNYQQAFRDTPRRFVEDTISTNRRLKGPLKRYAWQLFAFFGLVQGIGLLIDFQYLSQLDLKFNGQEIASFLGLFGGILGLCELATQWFVSSRVLERLGVFSTAAILPVSVACLLPLFIFGLNLFPISQAQNLFWSLILVKFLDELLRYTFVNSSGPVLFQPIPSSLRSHAQTLSAGIAEASSMGIIGIVILATLWLSHLLGLSKNTILVGETIFFACVCIRLIFALRSRYVDLLVLSAERGQINNTNLDLRTLKYAVIEALQRNGTDSDKRSCIELLSQIDPERVGEVLAPLLPTLSSELQQQSLEVILVGGANPAYLPLVQGLLDDHTSSPEVIALALRYLWLSSTKRELQPLENYLHPEEKPVIRATAAALLLHQGTPKHKLTATKTLRRMLTHQQENERVCAVRALRQAVYLQTLRLNIPNLLQDESLGVRCAVLETIAATHLEEYYSALVQGLYYKSTRRTAIQALVQLEDEALPILLLVATNIYKPEVVRMYSWRAIGQIGTIEAVKTLRLYLEKSWGSTRRNILRTLLKMPKEKTIEYVLDPEGDGLVEKLIEQELATLGQIYAACIDLQRVSMNLESTEPVGQMLDLLQQGLYDLQTDTIERVLLLLKLIYPVENIQAVLSNLRSHNGSHLARGLEILDYTLKLRCKQVLLTVLDQRSIQDKLDSLLELRLLSNQRLEPKDRLRHLLDLPNSLSDWCLACCFYYAQAARIGLKTTQILPSLRHPSCIVREAAIGYLVLVSPRVVSEILPQLQNDPHPLVAAQVQRLMARLEIAH